MPEQDDVIINGALAEARQLKKKVAHDYCDTERFPPDPVPVSVFMAGSPGAGKTESSRSLIRQLAGEHAVLRIDADEFRTLFSKYNGSNSKLFQGAISILADYVHDCALDNNQSFVFDGTFSKIDKARQNIERSLKRGRFVQIVYVYQDPILAWKFVKERELTDGRNVPAAGFIDQYFQARDNVNQLKREFGSKLNVDLIVKNIDGSDVFYEENIDVIDSYIPERYSQESLSTQIRDIV